MILMDVSHAVYRTMFFNKASVIENYNFLSHLIVEQIVNFAGKFGASKQNRMVLAMDTKNSWRVDYYNTNKVKFPEMADMEYKGHRVKDPDLDWDKVDEVIFKTLQMIKEYTDYFVVKVDKAEGDDIIAVLCNEFSSSEIIWIMSSDKDFIQLQNTPKVNIFDPLKQAFKPVCDVEIFKKIHVMIGDKSDNIPAIKPRLGEKTAIKMLKELDTYLATNPDAKAHYQFNENLILFDKIPQFVKDDILKEFYAQDHTYNGMKLLGEFKKFDLMKHSQNVNKFQLVDSFIKTKYNQLFIDAHRNAELAAKNLDEFFS